MLPTLIEIAIVLPIYGWLVLDWYLWRKKFRRLEDRISILEAAALAHQESGEWNELN